MNIDEVLIAFDKLNDENPKSDDYWSYDSRESVENFIKFYKSINKPSTTTNEQPTTEQIDNALDCLHGDNSCNHSNVISYLNQFT